MGFKDIEYDIPVYQIKNTQIHDYTNMQIHKYKVLKRPYMCYIFEKAWDSRISTFTLHLQIDGASSRSIERYFKSSISQRILHEDKL